MELIHALETERSVTEDRLYHGNAVVAQIFAVKPKEQKNGIHPRSLQIDFLGFRRRY